MSPPPSASNGFAAPLPLGGGGVHVSEFEQARLRRHAFLAVVVAAVCIGFSAIFVRLADVGPAAIGFWRLLFALGPTALWAYAERRGVRAGAVPSSGARYRSLALTVLAGLFFAADLVLFHAGLARTSTANGVLLGNIAPVFIVLFAWACLGERPTAALVIALALALGGSAVIVLDSSLGGGSASFIGDLMCIAAASCYAAYMIVVRGIRRDGERAALGGGMVALISSGAGMVFCLVWAIAAGEQLAPASLQGFLAVAGLGIITHAFGQGLATFALGRLPAGLISVVLLLQMVVGMGMATMLFGEVPSWVVLAGGGLIVLGVTAVRPR
ncbi:MAG TPA: DMT family transporter [Xanthobacteraceae bacterium]|nr:DMT family transporter [Xanthobacteraceae bacterium]